ncbi:hypothetical protein THAOC_12974 [Thalassiosira oceanica]|uniref:Uncharacterized protein n=1 Tax=Thalassiosira oceanica TaxID=159749 RepID=K0SMD5_THAOC|nr:hypothetical protein THAOC_12974 [Thalassiosira oceanica]|eukprot:EJK66119.1 hypothetical protein THAOC_12974 [Thalassiosira oceanica]
MTHQHIAATSTSSRSKQLVATLKSQQAPPELARIDGEVRDDASTGRRSELLCCLFRSGVAVIATVDASLMASRLWGGDGDEVL